MSQKEIDRKVKTQESLTFEQSDIWDTIIYIIDEAAKSEISVAIGQHEDESTRAHSCGRAEGIVFLKELLESTRTEARHLSGRNNS